MNNEIETITISQRLERMRRYLIDKGLSAFVIPSNCEHFGEYVQEHFKRPELKRPDEARREEIMELNQK